MLKFVQFSSFSAVILWVSLGAWSNPNINIGELRKNKSVEVVPVPNSTDVQITAEALYLSRLDDFPEAKSLSDRRRRFVDVCKLSNADAIHYCRKLQSMYMTSGRFYLADDGYVEDCKPYPLVLYHTHSYATRDTVKARKCSYQPGELFITSGNKHMSLFVLTWVNTERSYLHVDNYMDVGIIFK